MAVTTLMVAERAGVSKTTVSRVLNGQSELISEATKERVFAAARDLNYRPNRLAISLRKQQTMTVGLLVGDISDAYFHVLTRGVEDVAREAGFHVMLVNTDRVPSRERFAVELLRDQQADGVIFAGGSIDNDRHLESTDFGHMKVVCVGPHRLPWPTIEVDHRRAIADAVVHLAEQGCQRIACIGKRPSWAINQMRLEGYRMGLDLCGLEYDPTLEWEGGFTFELGLETTTSALDRGIQFDGIVAFNDYAAVGAMRALRVAGLDVPNDVAVVGCNDIPLAAMANPQLTSIGLPIYEYGTTAMRTMLELIAGREVSSRIELPHELNVRESSARQGAANDGLRAGPVDP